MKIMGNKIYLKLLSENDVTVLYVKWMQDIEILQFLEYRPQTACSLEELKQYVKKMNTNSDNFLFGIFLTESGKHIGNIKIGSINSHHKFADVGLIIGEKSEWGKGYATEAIKLVTEYAFTKLNLNKLFAGIYAKNTGSYKAFLKAGYEEAGRLKKHRFVKGEYQDQFLVEKINKL